MNAIGLHGKVSWNTMKSLEMTEEEAAMVETVAERVGDRALDAVAMQLRRRSAPKCRFYIGRNYTNPGERMTVFDALFKAVSEGFGRVEMRWPGDVRLFLSVAGA